MRKLIVMGIVMGVNISSMAMDKEEFNRRLNNFQNIVTQYEKLPHHIEVRNNERKPIIEERRRMEQDTNQDLELARQLDRQLNHDTDATSQDLIIAQLLHWELNNSTK